MKKITLFVLLLSQVLAAKKSNQELMQQKLVHMKLILDGMVNEKYPQVATAARQLKDLNKAAAWHVIDDQDFQRHAKNFQVVATNLYDQAKNKDHDGVALSYMSLTFSCLNCHQQVRKK